MNANLGQFLFSAPSVVLASETSKDAFVTRLDSRPLASIRGSLRLLRWCVGGITEELVEFCPRLHRLNDFVLRAVFSDCPINIQRRSVHRARTGHPRADVHGTRGGGDRAARTRPRGERHRASSLRGDASI